MVKQMPFITDPITIRALGFMAAAGSLVAVGTIDIGIATIARFTRHPTMNMALISLGLRARQRRITCQLPRDRQHLLIPSTIKPRI